jgi:hypothetical protein
MRSDKELAAMNEFAFLFVPRMTSEGRKKKETKLWLEDQDSAKLLESTARQH